MCVCVCVCVCVGEGEEGVDFVNFLILRVKVQKDLEMEYTDRHPRAPRWCVFRRAQIINSTHSLSPSLPPSPRLRRNTAPACPVLMLISLL